MSFGDFLGGALQGIGAGIATKGKIDMESAAEAAKQEAMSKREMVLARIAHNDKLVQQQQASNLRKDEINTEYDRKEAYGANADTRALKADLAKLGVQFANAAKLEKLKGDQDRMTAAAKAALENGEVVGTKTAEDGTVMLYTRGGKTINAGYKERPTGSGGALDPDNPFGAGGKGVKPATPGAPVPTSNW